jgi:hypothetical protein
LLYKFVIPFNSIIFMIVNRSFLSILIIFGLHLSAQVQPALQFTEVNQDKWQPEVVGAHYFLPNKDLGRLLKGSLKIETKNINKFLLFKDVDFYAAKSFANAFHQDSTNFDSICDCWNLYFSFFALNRFDIDKLPVLVPGLYVLNPELVGNGKTKTGLAALTSDPPGASSLEAPINRFGLDVESYIYLPPIDGLVVFLDGPIGAKYKWKGRKFESDFIFSVKGAPNLFSYKTRYSKKNGIYVSLRPALGHWFLYDWGLDWWGESSED